MRVRGACPGSPPKALGGLGHHTLLTDTYRAPRNPASAHDYLLTSPLGFRLYDDQQDARGGLQMPKGSPRYELEGFDGIVQRDESLAPYTYLKVGGPAEMLVQPRTPEELAGVVQQCFVKTIPLRVLGGGCNILVRDEGVRGAVIRLSEPAFALIQVS